MTVQPTARRNFLAGFIITIFGSILFSTKAIIVKLAFAATAVDAITLLTLRMVFSLPFYIGIGLFASNKPANIYFTKKQWFYVLVLGLVGYYVSSLCDFVGLQYISAGLERLILFLYPTFAVLLNALIFKKKINGFQKLALALTYIGIAIAYFGELTLDTTSPGFFKGSFFVFMCAVAFSIYIVGSGRMIPQTGATKFTSYAMMAAGIGVLLHYFLSGGTFHRFSNELLLYAFVLAIIATVIPTFLISNGIRMIGSNNVAIISSLGPVSTIIQANLILGEKIHIGQIIGTVLVIIGILLIGWRSRMVND